MSTIIMAACWPITQMSASQKAVLISLADQANDDGVCWPSVNTISERTCLSERAVQEALSWLQKTGIVFRTYRNNTSTSYTIKPAAFKPENAPASRTRVKQVGALGAPGADSAPPAGGAPGGADSAPGGALGAPLGVQEAHPNHQGTVIEPSMNHSGQLSLSGPVDGEALLQSQCRETWASYKAAYAQRYGTDPIRNASVNAKVKQLVSRLGLEAPAVAEFYVSSVGDAFVVRNCHSIGVLLQGAEAYRTQWFTGQAMTGTKARQVDQSQSNFDAAGEALAILRAKRGGEKE